MVMGWIIFHCFLLLFLELFLECINDAQSVTFVKKKSFVAVLMIWCLVFLCAFLKQNQIYFLYLQCLAPAIKASVLILGFFLPDIIPG